MRGRPTFEAPLKSSSRVTGTLTTTSGMGLGVRSRVSLSAPSTPASTAAKGLVCVTVNEEDGGRCIAMLTVLKNRSKSASAASRVYSPLDLVKPTGSLSYDALFCKSLNTSKDCAASQNG